MHENLTPIKADIPFIGECIDEEFGIYVKNIYALTEEEEKHFFKLLRKANTKHHVEWGYKLWNYLLAISKFSGETRLVYRAIPGKGVLIIQQGEYEHNTEDRLKMEKRLTGNSQSKVGFLK